MPRVIGFVLAVMLASCQSTNVQNAAAIEDAVRIGAEACERHFLDELTMEEAVAAAAHGGPFELVERRFEHWTPDSKPWRLDGMNVWVGLDGADRCVVLAIDGGSVALRDAIMKEHIAKSDRVWTNWSTGGGGKRAVCTTDRIPSGRSLLVGAYYDANPDPIRGSDTQPPPATFRVTVVDEKTCDRNS